MYVGVCVGVFEGTQGEVCVCVCAACTTNESTGDYSNPQTKINGGDCGLLVTRAINLPISLRCDSLGSLELLTSPLPPQTSKQHRLDSFGPSEC